MDLLLCFYMDWIEWFDSINRINFRQLWRPWVSNAQNLVHNNARYILSDFLNVTQKKKSLQQYILPVYSDSGRGGEGRIKNEGAGESIVFMIPALGLTDTFSTFKPIKLLMNSRTLMKFITKMVQAIFTLYAFAEQQPLV